MAKKQYHRPGKEPKHKLCPKFEDAVVFYLENTEDQKIALEFAAWLRKNRMSPLTGTGGYNWYINVKGHHVCSIKMYNDTWYIIPWSEHRSSNGRGILNDVLAVEKIKEVVWDNISECMGCNYGCKPNFIDINIHGREIKGVCRSFFLRFRNPDSQTVEILKEILLTNKNM